MDKFMFQARPSNILSAISVTFRISGCIQVVCSAIAEEAAIPALQCIAWMITPPMQSHWSATLNRYLYVRCYFYTKRQFVNWHRSQFMIIIDKCSLKDAIPCSLIIRQYRPYVQDGEYEEQEGGRTIWKLRIRYSGMRCCHSQISILCFHDG